MNTRSSAVPPLIALQCHHHSYLCATTWRDLATVDLTPDGHGDAIKFDPGSGRKTFVIPHEEKLTFKQLLSLLHVDKHDFKTNSSCADSKDDIPKDSGPAPGLCVPYLQHQNSSFTEEFSTLHADVEELSFASEVFGHNASLVNFWMGDSRAVSSLHHDFFENIYCVVAGEKLFTLVPPCDFVWLQEQKFPKGQYVRGPDSKFSIVPDREGTEIPWLTEDPDNLSSFSHPYKQEALAKGCSQNLVGLAAHWTR